MTGTWGLLVVLVVLWLLQFALAHLQARRFMQAVNELRKPGSKTAVGVAGKGWGRPRVYVAISAAADGRVRAARQLRGVTVLARPTDVPELAGRELSSLADTPGEDPQAQAAAMAARTLIKARDESAGTAERGAETQAGE